MGNADASASLAPGAAVVPNAGAVRVAGAATPALVWARLADGATWPSWARVEWAVFEPSARAGAYVTVKPQRRRQTAWRIIAAEPQRRFALALTIGPLAALTVDLTIALDESGCLLTADVQRRGLLRGVFASAARRLEADLPARLARLGDGAA